MSQLYPLNLPTFNHLLQIKVADEKRYIFDQIRKKWLVFQPEEWVRQLFIQYLLTELNIPIKRISVEVMIKVNNMARRYDLAISDKNGNIQFLLECKSFKEKLSTKTFRQIAAYNSVLGAPYLCVTNGKSHYLAQISELKEITFLTSFPNLIY